MVALGRPDRAVCRSMTPRPPAHIEPYVKVLGAPLAVEFFLTFGGGDLYMPRNPQSGSRLVEFVGMEKARALAQYADKMPARVPIPKQWIASYLRANGMTVEDIARKLHTSNVAVRRWFADGPDSRQLPLI